MQKVAFTKWCVTCSTLLGLSWKKNTTKSGSSLLMRSKSGCSSIGKSILSLTCLNIYSRLTELSEFYKLPELDCYVNEGIQCRVLSSELSQRSGPLWGRRMSNASWSPLSKNHFNQKSISHCSFIGPFWWYCDWCRFWCSVSVWCFVTAICCSVPPW